MAVEIFFYRVTFQNDWMTMIHKDEKLVQTGLNENITYYMKVVGVKPTYFRSPLSIETGVLKTLTVFFWFISRQEIYLYF